MSQVEGRQSAIPAGTASAAVISLQSREVSKTKSPTGNAPVLASAEATTTKPQPTAAAATQEATPAPTNRTFANAKVPDSSQALAVQPPIVPLPANEALAFLGVKPDIKDMTLDEKFTCLKHCFAYGYGVRKVLCEVFESIRAEFKTYAKNRADMPTVEEAFKQRGLNYHTVYSAIQREKDRRAEDAQFFAAIKAQASDKNIHGVAITNDDLPIGAKVILGDGTKGQVLAAGEKKAPDAEPSFEIVTEEGTSVQVRRGDLITLAEKEAAKAAAKAAKAATNTPEAQKEAEEKETARIAAAAAKEDAALKSSDFYKEQYFQLLSLINAAPKEMTPAEFAQTVNDSLRVAYESLNAEEAKLIKPAPQFPVTRQGNESKLFTFLSEGRVDRKSMLDSVFGGIDEESFLKHVRKFSQRICDKFHDGVYEVSVYSKNDRVVIDKAAYEKLVAEAAALRKAAKVKTAKPVATETPTEPPLEPDADVVSTTKVGDKTEPTPHGFYYEFIKDEKPYAVRDVNNPNLGILCKCKNKAEAELKIATYEREAVEAMATADGADVPKVCEKDYTEEEVAAMFASSEGEN